MTDLRKINELFDFEKGTLQSSKCISGKYDFVTAGEKWKTHKEYAYDKEALIVAVAASGSLGRVHYVNGKFISSDLCFILTPKDKKNLPIDLSFYFHVFKLFREDLVKKTATGTSKMAINKTNFGNYKIPYFDIEHQNKYKDKLIKLATKKDILIGKIKDQKITLQKLRQSILQDAIEGKMTVDWRKKNPNVEPASELLKKIKAEKEKLIAEKKIKKEKPLPEISKEEIPFELPKGWEWCRLGNVIKFTENLDIQSKLKNDTIINYIDIDSIDNKKYCIREIKTKSVNKLSSRARRILKKDYIIYSLVRPYLNNIAIIDVEKDNFIGSTGFAVFSGVKVVNKYLFYLLLSEYIKRAYLQLMSGFNSPSVSHEQFKNTLTPLSSLNEQKAIVEKVDKLMQKLDKLEVEISQNQKTADMLMQAVLKEAFEK